jgi:hypothetical protein
MPAACKVVGLWLRFHATIGLLCHCLQEPIFVILQEATTLVFFPIVLLGRELLALQYANCLSQEATTTTIMFLCHIAMSKRQ